MVRKFGNWDNILEEGMAVESEYNVYEKIVEISQKLNNTVDFDTALKIAVEEIQKALDVNRVQIILHRSEQDLQ
jgi:hypothetical protein